MKRKLQRELESVVDGIIAGSLIRKIIVSGTPGGGKSCVPIIAGKLILAGLADGICWICPRTALQEQGARGFVDPFFRELFCHTMTIRTSTNERNPARGTNGFITTYQAIGVDDKQTVLIEIRSKRYIVILDEPHHVGLDGEWEKELKPIMAAAAYWVMMSGTFERGDGDRIAFIDYEATGSAWIPNFDKPDMAYIQYTRSDALAEKAILPTKFFTHDGHAKWKDKNGEIRQTNSLAKTYGYDIAPAIYTALETDFANELMDKTLAHWSNYRQSNPRSKLLVVCAGIEGARRMLEHLKNNGVNAKIATSHESANAHENIRQFKDGWIDAIVTIAMAYEGLDVPEITHTACLTHIRSKPWLEQMLARGVRVDRNAGVYETQCAYVFAPDDVLFREVMNKIKEDQEPYAKRQPKQQGLFGEELAEGDGTKSFGFTPLGSGLTGHREAFFGSGQQPHIEQPIETPDELEARLRDEMENHVRVYSFQNRLHPAEINTEIKKQFGIKRSEMTSAQLEKALDFIKMKWPKNHRRGTLNKRVPNRAVETGGRECNRWEL